MTAAEAPKNEAVMVMEAICHSLGCCLVSMIFGRVEEVDS